MSFDLSLLLDPLFRVPLFTGLCLAGALPAVGAYLMLRREWLAALGLSHIAAAGAMVAGVAGAPPVAGALALSGLGAALKGRWVAAGNAPFALMILGGYAGTMLLAGLSAHGPDEGKALMEGQLYFTRAGHLGGAVGLLALCAAALPALHGGLLTDQLFPRHHEMNNQPAWRHRLAFDLLTAAALTLGTLSLGVMATFALVLLPSLTVFTVVTGWWRALAAGVAVGVGAYAVAFVLALGADLPFGPVMVAVGLAAWGVGTLAGLVTGEPGH